MLLAVLYLNLRFHLLELQVVHLSADEQVRIAELQNKVMNGLVRLGLMFLEHLDHQAVQIVFAVKQEVKAAVGPMKF